LTASQKDGVVRIWSWGSEPGSNSDSCDGPKKLNNFHQIIIRLTKNSSSVSNTSSINYISGHRRGRGGTVSNTTSDHVWCDVAIWTSDDSKIITSQYSTQRSTGTEAVPGSQAIFIWDSFIGQCLMGLHASHSSGCPVLISHPLDPTILVSAGSDGRIRFWDLDNGRELYSHLNSLEHGPMEPPLTKGQACGYLDGDFSEDGLTLILTDDVGRICIIDVFVEPQAISSTVDLSVSSLTSIKEPTWMKEQYFANDYYDLFYDMNGYSIEQGSGQPTHLAPRAARCNHNGVPYPECIQDAFLRLAGPMPLKQADVRRARESLRSGATLVRRPGGMLEQNVHGKRPMILSNCTESTLYVRNSLPMFDGRSKIVADASNQNNRGVHSTSPSRRTLSTNFRWRDYEDIPIEDEIDIDEMDEDDEEYNENNGTNRANESLDEDDAISFDVDSDDSVHISTRQQRHHAIETRSHRERRTSRRPIRILDDDDNDDEDQGEDDDDNDKPRVRVSTHNLRGNSNQRFKYDDPDSSDEETEEFLSCSKAPTGEKVEDYTILGHYFKMPSKCVVHRKWVTRSESVTGLTGQRPYW
jgi:hypothetical protein